MKFLKKKSICFILLIIIFFDLNFLYSLEYTTIPAIGKTWKTSYFENPISIVPFTINNNKVLFIVEKTGKIKVISNEYPNLKNNIFIDLSKDLSVASAEEGLLGLAFHPNFNINKRFFIFRTVKKNKKRTNRISEFKAKSLYPLIADKNSEIILIDQKDDAGNHNAGDLHFGKDGYLYISLGDEGARDDIYLNSQLIDKDFFSGIIRIDVDMLDKNIFPNSHQAIKLNRNGLSNYKVPVDNPWVNINKFRGKKVNPNKVRSEFWAIGLRNVWKMSFDPNTNNLWAADVGQNQFEEINIIKKGGNYGWAFEEGYKKFHSIPKHLISSKHKDSFIKPVLVYGRKKGSSITGGIVYREDNLKSLKGCYIFSDFVSGSIWSLKVNNMNNKPIVKKIAYSKHISSFAIDPRDSGIIMSNYANNRIEKLVLKK